MNERELNRLLASSRRTPFPELPADFPERVMSALADRKKSAPWLLFSAPAVAAAMVTALGVVLWSAPKHTEPSVEPPPLALFQAQPSESPFGTK